MLGSFDSSSHDDDEEEPPPPPPRANAYIHQTDHRRLAQPPVHIRQLLISCAELVSRSDSPPPTA
ncbi:UNVERIFIED_CONTAM: hypothetical protein Slati_4020700 [Sesamum latifolium]|uniref:Uncharacterized protein n=1 Tax=Sesamum latifolium TaxID=2727402 RepID=A0AAW2TQ45_9LAMI